MIGYLNVKGTHYGSYFLCSVNTLKQVVTLKQFK